MLNSLQPRSRHDRDGLYFYIFSCNMGSAHMTRLHIKKRGDALAFTLGPIAIDALSVFQLLDRRIDLQAPGNPGIKIKVYRSGNIIDQGSFSEDNRAGYIYMNLQNFKTNRYGNILARDFQLGDIVTVTSRATEVRERLLAVWHHQLSKGKHAKEYKEAQAEWGRLAIAILKKRLSKEARLKEHLGPNYRMAFMKFHALCKQEPLPRIICLRDE